jgi:urease accessory protein
MLRAVAILRAGQTQTGEIVDTLLLDYDQRRALRGPFTGLKGAQIDIALPDSSSHSAPVATDDCFVLDDGRLIEVVARPEKLLEARAESAASMARLAWHLGDRHIPAQLHERRLRVRRDPATEKLLATLGVMTRIVDAPFEPEGGAYSGGHHHDHSHHHSHDHHGHDHHEHDT